MTERIVRAVERDARRHLDEDHECTDKENCRTEKLWKWTVEKLSGDAALTDDDHEVVSVRAKVTAGLAKLVDDVNQYAAAM